LFLKNVEKQEKLFLTEHFEIKEDIKEIVHAEIERIRHDPVLEHLVIRKKWHYGQSLTKE